MVVSHSQFKLNDDNSQTAVTYSSFSSNQYSKVIHVFDLDENIFHLPTKIVVFRKPKPDDQVDSSSKFYVTSSTFTTLKTPNGFSKLGLEDYELRFPESVANFAEAEIGGSSEQSYFLRDMKIAVHSLTSNLKGPMFPFFVESLSSVPDSVYILTARLQKSETIHSGLEYLLKCGWLPDIPKVGNIWPVANQGFNERVKKYLGVDLCTNDQMTNWSRNKGLFLQILRQKLGEQIFEEGEEQDRTKERILIKYSDDDYGNVQSVMECLGHMESAVDVAVYYTGDLVPPFATLISSRTSPVLSVSPEFDRRDIPATSNRNPLYLNRNPPPPVSTVIHSIFGGVVKVNTSNIIKLNEFKKYMSYYGHEGEILVEKNDLQEPDSDFVTIARYKASQFQNVLVDDTSLFIDFSSLPSHPLSSHQSAPPQLGTNVKHLLKTLDKYIGYSACFISILAIRVANKILIYRGEVSGTIVPRADPSNISMQLPIDQLGFLPWFKPNGQEKTLTEEFRDEVNARWHAMKELLEGREPWMVCDVLEKWDGKWQDE